MSPPPAPAPAAVALAWANEQFIAYNLRGLYWPRRRTLFVADVHLGKAASFRSAGLPVPGGTTAAALARLDRLLATTHATRLVVLGDLLHDRSGCTPRVFALLADWRARHAHVETILIRGNHDRRAADLPRELEFTIVERTLTDGPLTFCHEAADAAGHACALVGHVHPVVQLRSPAGALRCACFHFTPSVGTLPAFGDFTGGHRVVPTPADRVIVVAGEEICALDLTAA